MSDVDSRVLELAAVLEGNTWRIDGDHIYSAMNDTAVLSQREAATRAGAGQSSGILAHIQERPPRATFVEGSRLQVVDLGSGQAGTLRQKGLGTRWNYFCRQGKLQSMAVTGQDQAVVGAAAMLADFIRLVNAKKYTECFRLLSKRQQGREPPNILVQNYEHRFIAPHPEDIKLIEALPNKVTFRVRFTDDGDGTMFIEYPCAREGGQWRIDDCVVVHDDAGTKF